MRHSLARIGRGAVSGGALGLVLPALLLALWEALSRFGVAPPNLLPAPSSVLRALRDLWLGGELWGHIEITLLRVLLGFLLGTAVATVLGALTGYSPLWRRLLDPTLQALRSIPSIAWVPIFILWLGIFEASKVTLIAVGAFFPVYLQTMAGIQQVDRKLVEVARSLGLHGVPLAVRVLVPATLPTLLVGMRIGLTQAWLFLVAAELLGATTGLGFLLTDGQQTTRTDEILVAILLFALCGKLSEIGLRALERRAVGWADTVVA